MEFPDWARVMVIFKGVLREKSCQRSTVSRVPVPILQKKARSDRLFQIEGCRANAMMRGLPCPLQLSCSEQRRLRYRRYRRLMVNSIEQYSREKNHCHRDDYVGDIVADVV